MAKSRREKKLGAEVQLEGMLDLFGLPEEPTAAETSSTVRHSKRRRSRVVAERSSDERIEQDATAPDEHHGSSENALSLRTAQTAHTASEVSSVSELTRRIRFLIEQGVGEVWVEGEVSNLRKQSSGHRYFALKDEKAQLACVLFRGEGLARFELRDGDLIRAFGTVTVYEPQGRYQLVVRRLERAGAGELHQRFEALKAKLQAEGLFDSARKKPLPSYPQSIGIITSPTGAAIQDLLSVLLRRAPWLSVFIDPVRVQGEGAATEISAAIQRFSDPTTSSYPDVDLLIVGRGGGSIEDLWAFNEEVVARSIAACPLPVVSAVGHEIDFTIADFVADLRAPTPSAAAEMVVPDVAVLREKLVAATGLIRRAVTQRLEASLQRLKALRTHTGLREGERRLRDHAQFLDRLEERLLTALAFQMQQREERLQVAAERLSFLHPKEDCRRGEETVARTWAIYCERLTRRIEQMSDHLGALRLQHMALSPYQTLRRGFTITRLEDGRVLRSAQSLALGTTLITQFHDGSLASEVTESLDP